MLFQIESFLPLLLWTSIIPTNLAADSPPLSNFLPKSDYRCGISEYRARINCGRVCTFNSDCNSNEYCWGTSPNKCYVNELAVNPSTLAPESSTVYLLTPRPVPTAPTIMESTTSTPMNPTPSPLPLTFSPEYPPRSDFRCGINEEDSRTNCGKVCVFLSDCDTGEYCWSTFVNTCYIDDLPVSSPTVSPVDSTPLPNSSVVPTTLRPMTSAPVEANFAPVNMASLTPTPTEPTAAPIGATLTPVNVAPVAPPTPDMVDPTIVPSNPTIAPVSAAPVTPPASVSTTGSPASIPLAPSPESPLRSDFRCGINEEDSRTKCGKLCVFLSDCDTGEYCWSTFPNTCYIGDLLVGVPTDNPTSSTPLTSPPVTTAPATSAPVKATFAPINTSAPTASPINSVPLTNSPVTTVPTTLRPTTSAPVRATFAPVTFAPVTFAPISIVNPTPTPDTTSISCPEVPPNGCSVCGDNKCVGARDAIFEFPGQPAVPCGILERLGYEGIIPLVQCPMLPPLIVACECKDSAAPIDPTSAPVNPTLAPIDPTSAPVNPTPAPIDPTSAPVNPTLAPIEPTSVPVNPTPAPIDATLAPTVMPINPTLAPISAAPVTPPTPASFPLTPSPEYLPRSDFRCGTNEEDSRTNCGKVCIYNSDCEGGKYCWSTFPNTCYVNSFPTVPTQGNPPPTTENLEPISDFRCGTSEANARGNCKRECTTQDDCEIGEYCWTTLPNYCHANSEGTN